MNAVITIPIVHTITQIQVIPMLDSQVQQLTRIFLRMAERVVRIITKIRTTERTILIHITQIR